MTDYPAGHDPIAMSKPQIKYVCGFFFDRKLKTVILLWKEKPSWQKGKLNGIGGKIEENESPSDAMTREFFEETGLTYRLWKPLISLEGSDWIVHFYCGQDFENNFEYAETKEHEEVAKIEVDRLDDFEYIDNLRWLIPMAIEKLSGVYMNMLMLNQSKELSQLQSSNEEKDKEIARLKQLIFNMYNIGFDKPLGHAWNDFKESHNL